MSPEIEAVAVKSDTANLDDFEDKTVVCTVCKTENPSIVVFCKECESILDFETEEAKQIKDALKVHFEKIERNWKGQYGRGNQKPETMDRNDCRKQVRKLQERFGRTLLEHWDAADTCQFGALFKTSMIREGRNREYVAEMMERAKLAGTGKNEGLSMPRPERESRGFYKPDHGKYTQANSGGNRTNYYGRKFGKKGHSESEFTIFAHPWVGGTPTRPEAAPEATPSSAGEGKGSKRPGEGEA